MKGNTSWQDLLHPGDAQDFFARCSYLPFAPHADIYRTENARWLAELCRLVYRHDSEEADPPPLPTRSSFLSGVGFTQKHFFLARETDTQAMLVECLSPGPYAVLVFRGTEPTLQDFVTDIGTTPLVSDQINVHRGFMQALDSVWAEIADELTRLTCPVYYTGHSLGAALATLAAARRTPRALYTFGSPRVGNQAFVDSLAHIPIYRIVDDQDIVTTLPPESLGFRHAGTALILQGKEPSTAFFDKLRSPPKRWADHAPINYVDRIS